MNTETATDTTLMFAEYDTAVDSLEQALRFAQQDDPFRWKWMVLALDNALYTAALCCLSRFTNYVVQGAISDATFWVTSSGHAWFESYKIPVSHEGDVLKGAYRIGWHRHPNPPPKPTEQKPTRKKSIQHLLASGANVIGFWTALARVQDARFWMRQSVFTRPLDLDDTELYWVWCLHTLLRNPFVHCMPGQYGIPVQDMAQACRAASYAAAFLLCDSSSGSTIHLPEERRIRAAEAYKKLSAILKASTKPAPRATIDEDE